MMNPTIPLTRTPAILLVLLSLSIGWGIRGNYGHEAGAMIPGALAAVAAGMMSGREDWRSRIPYLAFFGALGWAFGGSIAYMVPPSYTFSGHLPTQVYGFFATYLEAFLWAGLGGAITVYAVVEDRDRITALFGPLLWILGIWVVQYVVQDLPLGIEKKLYAVFGADRSDFRQRDPLYWLDSEWLEAVLAILALCAYDLWSRRFEKLGHLALYSVIGGALGWGFVVLLTQLGWETAWIQALVHPQGDTSRFPVQDLVTNWPSLLTDLGHHVGWVLGAIAGAAVYFRKFGAWREGSDLLMRMALWSLGIFIIGPVLLSNLPVFQSVGGFRLAPPRGDSWANTLGCFVGLVLHFRKTGQKSIVFSAFLAGALGGVALTSSQFLKLLLVTPGNPVLTQDVASIEFWKHWRSANWHSIILEQWAGFLYGLSVLVPLAWLSHRIPVRTAEPRTDRWTESFSVLFVLCGVGYLNIVKNLNDWTAPHSVGGGVFRSVELTLRAPLLGHIEASPWAWFTIAWLGCTLLAVWLLARHSRQPIPLIPSNWMGKGQLFYLAFLWMMVTANFTKALVAFHESRIATEGTIFFNAVICTGILLLCSTPSMPGTPTVSGDFENLTKRAMGWTLASCLAAMVIFTAGIRGLYGDQFVGWGGNNVRFGDHADWREKPILKSGKHR